MSQKLIVLIFNQFINWKYSTWNNHWKWNFPYDPSCPSVGWLIGLSVGWSVGWFVSRTVCHNVKFHFPCNYRSTFFCSILYKGHTQKTGKKMALNVSSRCCCPRPESTKYWFHACNIKCTSVAHEEDSQGEDGVHEDPQLHLLVSVGRNTGSKRQTYAVHTALVPGRTNGYNLRSTCNILFLVSEQMYYQRRPILRTSLVLPTCRYSIF